MERLTPRQIVAELDKYIIGQHDAKRAVAIALRNRWRRQRLPAALRGEVAPKNIIMIGPTGVGKTAIARGVAQRAGAKGAHRRGASAGDGRGASSGPAPAPGAVGRLRCGPRERGGAGDAGEA